MAEVVDDAVELVKVEEKEEPEISLEKVPVKVAVGAKVEAEYQRLANKLGTYAMVDLTQEELERYLAKNHIGVYPMGKVTAYLASIAAKMASKRRTYYGTRTRKAKVVWLPLRYTDIQAAAGKNQRIYTKPVPPEVLMTVEKIVEDLGDRPAFFISDFSMEERVLRKKVDPFLAISVGSKMYVLERWDEPGFRM